MGLAWRAELSPPGSDLARAPSDSSSTQGLAQAQGSARLEGMWGLRPSPPEEIIRSGKSLSDGRCRRGEGPAGAGGNGEGLSLLMHREAFGWSSFAPFSISIKPSLAPGSGPGTPFPRLQCGRGPISPQHPGEGSRGAHSRLQSCCQMPLALCPGLFSSRETQRHSWKTGMSHKNSTTAVIAQDELSLAVGCLRVLLEQHSPTMAQARGSARAYPPTNSQEGRGCEPRLQLGKGKHNTSVACPLLDRAGAKQELQASSSL